MVKQHLYAVLGLTVSALVMIVQPQLSHAGADNEVTDAPPGGPFVGVWTSGPSAADAAALDDLSVGWARLSVSWSSVQPNAGTFDWTALDQSMALARGNGQRRVLALVRDNPAWAAAIPCTLTSDAERQNLASFMSALATRYPGVVWQFYNEEDNTSPAADAQYGLGGCFGTLADDGTPTLDGPLRYARMLEAVSPVIRAVDPTAQLAAGGVASANFIEFGGGFDRQFLPGVMAHLKEDNSLASVDYVAVHYYSSQTILYFPSGPDLIGRINQLRQDIVGAGLTTAELKPFISDELSYTDMPGISTSDATDPFNLAQAAYVPKLLARSAAADVRMAFWFWMQDTSAGLGSDVPYGLKATTGAVKPSYQAMKYFTSQISRLDQLRRTLDLSAVGAGAEGYEFAVPTGGSLRVVWANQVGGSAGPYAFVPDCTIAEVRDALGDPAVFSAEANSVSIGAEPRYVLCAGA
jgi:hypothetical protein